MPRLLSLDGGGTWALLQVRALIDLYGYDATGYDVLRDIDLVAANSGGSIVAACLAAGWPLSRTLDLFLSQDSRSTIFVPASFLDRLENTLLGIGPKFSTTGKLNGLTEAFGAFGATNLGAVPASIAAQIGKPVHFLITAFDFDRCRGTVFRSNEASLTGPLVSVPLPTIVDAVHASSTAPVKFFDSPTVWSGTSDRYWDGAMSGMNNPVLLGAMDLLTVSEDPTSIQVLSIGTGSVRFPLMPAGAAPSPFYASPATNGILSDIKEAAGCIIDDPPDESTFLAYLSLRGHLPAKLEEAPIITPTFCRISPMVQPLCTTADPVNLSNAPTDLQWPYVADPTLAPGMAPQDVFTALSGLDIGVVDKPGVDLLQLLSTAWIQGVVYNQPIRSNRSLGCEIGHRFYPAAKANWLRIVGREPPPVSPSAGAPST